MKTVRTRKFLTLFISFALAAMFIQFFSGIKTEAAQALNFSITTSRSSDYVESTIKTTISAYGGKSPYKYKFWYQFNNGDWTALQDYSTKNTASLTAKKAGSYIIIVRVKDAANKEVTHKSDPITVLEKYVNPTNKSTVSTTVINKGGKITVKGAAINGTKPYQFKYYYTDQKGVDHTVKDFSTTASVLMTFNTPGFYTIHCSMKDKLGKAVYDKVFSVTVKYNTGKTLKSGFTLSSSSVFTGTKVTITGNASGGNQPYQYDYSYSLNGSAFKSISAYSKSAVKAFTPSTAGYYRVKVAVKDMSGKTNFVYKDLTVKKNTNKTLVLKTAEINTTSLVDRDTTVKVTAAADGGTMPYKYKFEYKIDSGNWKTMMPYSTYQTSTIKLTGRGKYSIRVTVMDSANTEKSKTCYVTSITKVGDSEVAENINSQYGLSASYTIKDSTQNAQYEIHERVPSSSQWNLIRSYGVSKKLSLRPRYNGVTTYLIRKKVNNKVTDSYFKITTYIPAAAQEVCDIVNAERKKAGLNPVTLDTDLIFAAGVRAEELKTKYSHTRPDGTDINKLLKDYSIITPNNAPENISFGEKTADDVMYDWMHSKTGHKEYILDKNAVKMGVNVYNKYWAQVFIVKLPGQR